MRFNSFVKMSRCLIGGVSISFLAGCGGGDGGDGGSPPIIDPYKVEYSSEISAAESVESKLTITVSESNLTTHSSEAEDIYSITIPGDHDNLFIKNNCTDRSMGESCDLDVSLIKESASVNETINWKVTLPDGTERDESTVVKKTNLQVNIPKVSVLESDEVNTITLVNGSDTVFHFGELAFVSATAVDSPIIKNSCDTSIASGEQCSFDIQAAAGVEGELRFGSETEILPIAKVKFLPVIVTGVKTQDIPANAAVDASYPFTYTFSNTSLTYPATGVKFINGFTEDGIELDEDSTCKDDGILKDGILEANSSCTWKGTFTPKSTSDVKNINMSSILEYTDGETSQVGQVALTSSSRVTSVAVTGTKTQDIPANVAVGVSYPFTYTFSNTSAGKPATGVNFTKILPEDDGFVLDEDSTCKDGTLNAGNSCTLKGTFTTPQSISDFNKSFSMSLTLNYNEGNDVTLAGASMPLLLPTVTINSGTVAPAEIGWNWPSSRFAEQEGAACAYGVYDKLTGLIWTKDGSSSHITWEQANTQAESLDECGCSSWRLPTVNELGSLINYSVVEPAAWLNDNGFNGIDKNSVYYTSTEYTTGNVWLMHFDDGKISTGDLTRRNGVLYVCTPD